METKPFILRHLTATASSKRSPRRDESFHYSNLMIRELEQAPVTLDLTRGTFNQILPLLIDMPIPISVTRREDVYVPLHVHLF
jgi:hypothetical protein